MTDKTISQYMSKLGTKGGKASGERKSRGTSEHYSDMAKMKFSGCGYVFHIYHTTAADGTDIAKCGAEMNKNEPCKCVFGVDTLKRLNTEEQCPECLRKIEKN